MEPPLSVAAREVFDGTVTTAAELRDRLKTLAPSNATFQEAFERARVTSAKLGRYYLRSLERAAKGENDPWFLPEDDKVVINLEHVLPQKPEGSWPDITEDDVIQYSKRLGNLALMLAKDNSHLRSASFAEKREVYKKSPYELTSQIATRENWTPVEIQERQKELAKLALRAWPTS